MSIDVKDITNPGSTLPEGIQSASEEKVEHAPLKVYQEGKPLSSLAPEYVLFHHALLFELDLSPDPVMAFFQETNLSDKLKPLQIFLKQPYISKLSNPWNRVVYAIPAEVWESLSKYIDRTSFTSRMHKLLLNCIRQEIPVVDFQALTVETGDLPKVQVQFIGLDGNKGCFHYRPAKKPFGMVELVKDKPLPETISQAAALFG